jgi:hypothetical protein
MKNIVKFLGIIAIVAVIGFSMAACKEEESTVDIIVTNNSIYTSLDATVKAQVWGKTGGTVPLIERNVSIGQSVTFTMDEGDYRVRVIDGLNINHWYPAGGNTVTSMKGTVRLKFTGSSLTLQ